MGFRSRLKNKLKDGIQNLRVMGSVIHEEAQHPGRPQPHMAARNPLWGGDDTPIAETSAPKNAVREEADLAARDAARAAVPPSEEGEEAPDYWFLKYDDNEGWDETNPGELK